MIRKGGLTSRLPTVRINSKANEKGDDHRGRSPLFSLLHIFPDEAFDIGLRPFAIIIHLLQMPDNIHVGLVVKFDHDAFDVFSLICVIVFISFSYAQ